MQSFTATVYDTPTQGTGYILVSESGFSVELTSGMGPLKEFDDFWKKNDDGVWLPYINELVAFAYNPLINQIGEKIAENLTIEYAVSDDTVHLLGWSNAVPYSPLTYYDPSSDTVYKIEATDMSHPTPEDQLLGLQPQEDAVFVTNCETGMCTPVDSEHLTEQISNGELRFAVPVR